MQIIVNYDRRGSVYQAAPRWFAMESQQEWTQNPTPLIRVRGCEIVLFYINYYAHWIETDRIYFRLNILRYCEHFGDCYVIVEKSNEFKIEFGVN